MKLLHVSTHDAMRQKTHLVSALWGDAGRTLHCAAEKNEWRPLQQAAFKYSHDFQKFKDHFENIFPHPAEAQFEWGRL